MELRLLASGGDYPELPGKPNVIMSILKRGRRSRREPESTHCGLTMPTLKTEKGSRSHRRCVPSRSRKR